MSSSVKFKGKSIALSGKFPQNGDSATRFNLVDAHLADRSLSDFQGKKKVLNIFPSVDTGTCAMSVRKFNQLASDMNNCIVLCISSDLPFAQARFCGAEGIENVTMLSTMRGNIFKQNYGVEIVEGPMAGLAARAVIILDENDKVIYSQLVEEISQEPDYDAAINALS